MEQKMKNYEVENDMEIENDAEIVEFEELEETFSEKVKNGVKAFPAKAKDFVVKNKKKIILGAVLATGGILIAKKLASGEDDSDDSYGIDDLEDLDFDEVEYIEELETESVTESEEKVIEN